MKPIIKSILDQDLYKFTTQQAALELFPEAVGESRFINRGLQRFTPEFLSAMEEQVHNFLPKLKLTNNEYSWAKPNIPYLKPQYLCYLRDYRFDPSEITRMELNSEGDLLTDIEGDWRSSTLWEVVLMALISEIYFDTVETDWKKGIPYEVFRQRTKRKSIQLNEAACVHSDFGTRRRRSYLSQDIAIQELKSGEYFAGTSNVHFAMKYGIPVKGTFPHEWVMAMQALESMNHCNYYALENWVKVYKAELGIALPDTITTNMFLRGFNKRFSMLYSGIRHDSGDPVVFTDKIRNHYKSVAIDPLSKFIVFSNALDTDQAIKINSYCKGKIGSVFGIGTHFTNDFPGSDPLNMVIKLWSINGFPVVKLSDDAGKSCGDEKAVEVMKWIVKNELGR